MHLPGWSIGWLLLHDPDGKLDNIKPGISKVGEIVGGGAATPIIAAAASVLEKITDFTAHLTESYKTLKRRANVTMKSIEEVEGLSLVKPKGGLWGYTKIDYGTTWKDDYAFAHQLLEEEAISIIPGPCWGPTYGPGHFRTTLLEPVELIEEAYRRIDSFLRRHC